MAVGLTGQVAVHAATAVLPAAGAGHTVGLPGAVSMAFLPVAAGVFTLGSDRKEADASPDEWPATQVQISRPFWLARTEVTQAQWEAFGFMNRSRERGAELPVAGVAWDEAAAYCERLTALERAAGRLPPGYVYRLPTEAEWEYACRAGTTGPFAGDVDRLAWHEGNAGGRVHPVGTRLPNDWGFHDLHGNVWEWCADWHGAYPGGRVTDPAGPAAGEARIFRGGSWVHRAMYARSANRGGYRPDLRYHVIGFRVALALVLP